MKKMVALMATGIFLVGVTGIAQAAGYYNAREDCCTEGPSYNRDSKQGPIVPTKVVYQETLYIEGMGFPPRPQGPETVIPIVSDRCDYCSEGFSADELEYMLHIKRMNKIEPAAGN